MRLGDIIDRLMVLLSDAYAAEKLLEKADSQFARRAYIRSGFSLIEGSIWVFNSTVLDLSSFGSQGR